MRSSPRATEPTRTSQYARPLVRRASAATSPFDPDWLLQRHLQRDVAAALRRHAAGRLLDVGCGGRPYAGAVPPGTEYVGVDAPGGAARPDAWALAAALPFADAAFDAILCTQVLEHVADPAAAIAEMARLLRPGGHLLLSGPQAWFLHEEPFDFFRFTRYGLEQLCRRAGLEPIRVQSQGGFFAMAGIFLAVHLGSYVQWAAERSGRRPLPVPGETPRWRRLLAPLRFPLALVNVLFAVLDAIPQPGIFAVNHLVVAAKPAGRVEG